MMEYEEIARRLGISEVNARNIVSRALKRIRQAGDMDRFVTAVRAAELRREGIQHVRCGSIECRPEKW